MINFPVLDRLDISRYGLFPGPEGGNPEGLHVNFQTGITLILGANGLGKSTLVALIYRLLGGPFDIPGLINRMDLGTTRLAVTALSPFSRGTFAQRVMDGARNATGRLSFRLGTHSLVVERRLSDLALTHFSIDGSTLINNEQDVFQAEILKLVGVWSFGDWILLLRHLVFYFEDRRALVWDASAQRQILRLLFLPAETARKWTEDERAILELDSRMRNLSAALTREERALSKNELKAKESANIHEELKTLEKLQESDRERCEKLEDEVAEIEAQRQHARLRVLRAEQEREARFRELERAKLLAISARFPDRSDTARYIMAQLLTENMCLVCGSTVPEAASAYAARLAGAKCVVCGSDLSAENNLISSSDMSDKRVEQMTTDLAAAEMDMGEARQELQEAGQLNRMQLNEIQELNSALADRSLRIDSLVKQLPPAEAEMHKQRSELASMRSRVESLRSELTSKRQVFRNFIEEVSRELVTQSENIKQSFEEYARGFLLETCRLFWSTKKERLGETGELIEFPYYELEMTGTDFTSPVRRTGPEQVSESQREFIDLGFRMALMAVAGIGAVGTLLIDAPESSLDVVFVKRAADVLLRFAEPSRGNRLVVTCNLVEGRLIPSLLPKAGNMADRSSRIVDLFTIAAPTEAIRKLRPEYDKFRHDLLDDAGVSA